MNAQLDLWTDWLAQERKERRRGTRTLLADTPRSRHSDPDTSHQAAEQIRKSGALGRQQRAVLEAVRANPGKTAVELARLAGMDRYAVSRRLPELQPVYVRRGPPRDCTINGRPQSTWSAVKGTVG
jgi:predicted transcriptional regulator